MRFVGRMVKPFFKLLADFCVCLALCLAKKLALSQWWIQKFMANGVEYICAEQYMTEFIFGGSI